MNPRLANPADKMAKQVTIFEVVNPAHALVKSRLHPTGRLRSVIDVEKSTAVTYWSYVAGRSKAKHDALTRKQVAVLLQVSVATVARMIERGELPAFKVGRQWRIWAVAVRNIGESTAMASSIREPQPRRVEVE